MRTTYPHARYYQEPTDVRVTGCSSGPSTFHYMMMKVKDERQTIDSYFIFNALYWGSQGTCYQCHSTWWMLATIEEITGWRDWFVSRCGKWYGDWTDGAFNLKTMGYLIGGLKPCSDTQYHAKASRYELCLLATPLLCLSTVRAIRSAKMLGSGT